MELRKGHFGWFVRTKRDEKGFSQDQLAEMIGLRGGGRRVSSIETMEEPRVYGRTLQGLANALGFDDVPAFQAAWQNTEVEPPAENRRGRPRATVKISIEVSGDNAEETIERALGKLADAVAGFPNGREIFERAVDRAKIRRGERLDDDTDHVPAKGSGPTPMPPKRD